MFSINCLEITVPKKVWDNPEFQNNSRSLYKNLLLDNDFNHLGKDIPINKRFLFNDFFIEKNNQLIKNPKGASLPDDFFANKINVQAIVGMNGSGKSTLMDLMYMAINNFSYMFERGNKRKRPGAAEMYYVPGLYINLYFSFNKQVYILNCHDNCIKLKQDKKSLPIFENQLNIIHYDTKLKVKKNGKNIHKENMGHQEIAFLVKNFFYTITSNYSMQSFVDNNYKRQVYRYIDDIDIKKGNYRESYKNSDSNKEFDGNEPLIKSWISPIFHKNDGYIRSIVLNPYRDEGRIDLSNEYELSKDRFCSLLIYSSFKANVFFFKPYKYIKIKASFDNQKLVYMSNNVLRRYYGNIPRLFNINSIFTHLEEIKNNQDILANHIISKFRKKYHFTQKEIKDNFIYRVAITYIELKLIKIANQYDAYCDYGKIFAITYNDIPNQISQRKFNIQITNLKLLNEYLDKILNDSSHITKKIRRIGLFLQHGSDFPYNNGTYTFNLDTYKKLTRGKNKSPQLIDDLLPPPILNWQVYLGKEDDNGEVILDKKTGKPLEIPYNQLSSGEIQFIQTTSIHAYHLMNLISVPNNPNRPKYNHFNLVFDEVEICFHPEMQRQFIKRLIDMLQDLGINKENDINIFIITHSPFILSDMPRQNILYLKDGSSNKQTRTSPFAGNIGEMFYDSFFLKSTIGAFAEEKLRQLSEIRKNNRNESNIESIYDNIGNAVIKCLLSK